MDIIIVGIKGAMGRFVEQSAIARGHNIVAGIDVNVADGETAAYPLYKNFDNVGRADVIIDYSHHTAVKAILDYAVKTGTPAILCTTGYTEEELAMIKTASEKVAVFRSGNMSVGINLLVKLVKEGAKALGKKADVEIVEQHHHRKVDAPSGTALMLANAVKSVASDTEFVFGREGLVGKRKPNEVGIHAVRGGTIVGKHEVIFAMDSEVITLKHEAESRAVFAEGSIDAAEYMIGKGAGLYDMTDVLG